MSRPCDGPFGVRVCVSVSPLAVRVPVPTAPAATRVPMEGRRGPAGRDGAAAGSPTFIAATALGGHRIVRALPDGTVAYASADEADHAGSVVGLTTGACEAGASLPVQATGDVVEPSWAFLPGPVWLGFAGALTQTTPGLPTAAFSQPIGLAVSPTRVLLALGFPVLLA